MVEYIEQNILKIKWQSSADPENLAPFDYKAEFLISGSKKYVSIWQFLGSPGGYEQLPIIEIASEISNSPVSQVHLIDKRAFVSFKNSTFILYELVYDEHSQKKSGALRVLTKRHNLHSNQTCNDMLFCPQTNSVITCGNDGSICYFNVEENSRKIDYLEVAKTAIKCIDIINPNEIICGTLTGHLKHFDKRAGSVVGSYSSKSQSTLLCIQKNPNVNHLAIGGNDEGFINLYDLRNEHSAVAKIPAHNAAVTCVKYRPRDSRTIFSSSCNGSLLKWNINTDLATNQRPKAESLVSNTDCFSINSFDVNQNGHLIYTTDQEAIYYFKPDQLVDY